MSVAVIVGLLALASIITRAQPQPNIDELLVRIGERVSEFYNRAKNVVCIETSIVQGIDLNYSVVGFSRSVESELRIEANGEQQGSEATVVRTIRKINGRAARERDKNDRSGCTDPSPVAAEPLAFLLPAQRSAYQFRIAGHVTDRNRPALLIEFSSVNRRSKSELIEAPNGLDDCFDWVGHIASRGRVWVDANTFDVVRVERGLAGPVDVKVPALIERRYHLPNWVTLVRDDLILRYKTVAFSDPAEVLLLPESIITVNLVRGGLQSTRRSQTFSDYRRFVAEGKVLP